MFVAELILYINYLKELLIKGDGDFNDNKRKSYYKSFISNLKDGIHYYQNLPETFIENFTAFKKALENVLAELSAINAEYAFD